MFKRSFYFIALIFIVSLTLGGMSIPAFANEDIIEGFQPMEKSLDTDYLFKYPAFEMKVEPSLVFKNAMHVANGVAMRNRTSGTIHLRGVPVGSRVVGAFLYWNFLDNNKEGAKSMPVLFNGNRVLGDKTADTQDPCWGNVIASHSYRANVTPFVNMSGHPNQDYHVVLLFNGSTSTTGQNPWGPFESQYVRPEGATLIVVYTSPNILSGPVYIYDDLYYSMFYSSAMFYLFHDPMNKVSGLFTMAGADGQRGWGHNNFATGEKTYVNGTQIAGCPVISSDWDGSDGWPLPQLWDTHTHIVDLYEDVTKLQYVAGGDCLVPVVFVLDF